MRVNESVLKGKILLPPCVSRADRMLTESLHPDRIAIKASLRASSTQNSTDDTRPSPQEAVFYAVPEWGPPKEDTAKQSKDSDPQSRVWRWLGKETMHPFWVVKRCSTQDLKRGLVFNCALKVVQSQIVVLRTPGIDTQPNMTWSVEVPCLTNTCDLSKDTELIWERAVPKPKQNKKQEKTWKDVQQQPAKKLRGAEHTTCI